MSSRLRLGEAVGDAGLDGDILMVILDSRALQ